MRSSRGQHVDAIPIPLDAGAGGPLAARCAFYMKALVEAAHHTVTVKDVHIFATLRGQEEAHAQFLYRTIWMRRHLSPPQQALRFAMSCGALAISFQWMTSGEQAPN